MSARSPDVVRAPRSDLRPERTKSAAGDTVFDDTDSGATLHMSPKAELAERRAARGFAQPVVGAKRLASVAAPPFMSPAAKRRSKSPGSTAASSSRSPALQVKTEEGDIGDTSLVVDPSTPCAGCGRTQGAHYSYMAEGMPLSFSYSSKTQLWCHDCYTLWRTMYRGRFTLTLLIRYMENFANANQWRRELIAYLSLRQEGQKTIRSEAIKAREKTLEFVFVVVGIPYPSFVIKPLAAANLSADSFNSACFHVMANADGGRRVVVFEPLDAATARMNDTAAIQLRLPNALQQRLDLAIGVTDEDAEQMWSTHMPLLKQEGEGISPAFADMPLGTQAAPAASSKQYVLEVAGVPGDCVPMCKTRAAYDRALMTLKDFTTDKRFDMKEKPLTTCLKHILAVQHEVTNSPFANQLLPHLQSLVSTMDCAKKLLKPLIAYNKSSGPDKLSEIYDYAVPVKEFLEQRSERLGPQAFCIVWRSQVAHRMSDKATLCHFINGSFKELVRNNEERARADHHHMETMALEVVFDTLCNCLGLRIDGIAPDQCDVEFKLTLLGDMNTYMDVFHDLPISQKSLIEPLAELFVSMETILRASLADSDGVDAPSPIELKDAMELAKGSAKATKLRALVMESSVGQAIVADAELLLAASAMDEQADADFHTGVELLTADNMPHMHQGMIEGQLHTVMGSDRMMGAVLDAFQHFEHAVGDWSPLRASTQAPAIAKALDSIKTCIDFASGCLLHDAMQKLFEPLKISDECFDGWDASSLPLPEGFQSMCKSLDGKVKSDFGNLARSISEIEGHLECMTALSNDSQDIAQAKTNIEAALDRFDETQKAMTAAWAVATSKAECLRLWALECDGQAAESPMSAGLFQKLLIDYIESSNAPKESATLLAQVLELVDACFKFPAKATELSNEIAFLSDGQAPVRITKNAAKSFGQLVYSSHSTKVIKRVFIDDMFAEAASEVWRIVEPIRSCGVVAGMPPASASEPDAILRALLPKEATQRMSASMASALLNLDNAGFEIALRDQSYRKHMSFLRRMLLLTQGKQVNIGKFARNGGPLELQHAISLLELYRVFMDLLTTIAFLGHHLLGNLGVVAGGKGIIDFGTSEPARDSNLEVRPLVVHVLKAMYAQHKRASEFEERLQVLAESPEIVLTIKMDDLEKKLTGITYTMDALCNETVAKCAAELMRVAEKCEASQPRWSHIVSDTAYHPALAKRQLLGSRSRASLGPLVTGMYSLMESMAHMHESLAMQQTPENHPSSKSIVESAKVVYDNGVLTLAIIAGVNLVEEIKGDMVKGYAASYLSSNKHLQLPAALLKKVRELA